MKTLPKGGDRPSISNPNSNGPGLQRFTLQRDEDRPLQFDGELLAHVEALGSPLAHRAAVYRTRKGKFVSEFSSRPQKSDAGSVYSDPPREPTAEELAEHRESTIVSVIDTAEWREGKAQQYPDDLRNHASAVALRNLATMLDAVPLTDARWKVLWWAEYNLRDDLDDDDCLRITERQHAEKSDLLSSYGFYGDRTAEHPELEALSFLDNLIRALEDAAQPEEVPQPTGKAAVFDSLEAALGWFRPGRLTTELIRKLGRWDPEFIE